MHNIILNTDSYKFSQFNQYPPNTTHVFSYIESRGGLYKKNIFFGLQAFLIEYLSQPITQQMINKAERLITAHGEPFNREGWEYILHEHGGLLPVRIKSVDEGTVIAPHNVLLTIENTDPKCWWLTSYLETALLRAIWYPTTVASNSYHSKQIILEALERSGDPSLIDFKLHDFGARGVSSQESAGIGGAAHLINFMGTDTVAGMEFIMDYYYEDNCPAFSVPAMEHSTVTSWGRENELDSYRNMINTYAKKDGIVSIVSDSYDIYNACKLFGTELKDAIIESGATLVVRPDSGDPAQVVTKCAQILAQYFGTTTNAKGFKVLNHVRILQGDGIDHTSIRSILFSLELAGFSADNVTFGQGGALLQAVNRDTNKFAMKCSAAMVDGQWVDVFKDPITDSGKRSKKGRLALIKRGDEYVTLGFEDFKRNYCFEYENQLKLRFENGLIYNTTSFSSVRERAKNG